MEVPDTGVSWYEGHWYGGVQRPKGYTVEPTAKEEKQNFLSCFPPVTGVGKEALPKPTYVSWQLQTLAYLSMLLSLLKKIQSYVEDVVKQAASDLLPHVVHIDSDVSKRKPATNTISNITNTHNPSSCLD